MHLEVDDIHLYVSDLPEHAATIRVYRDGLLQCCRTVADSGFCTLVQATAASGCLSESYPWPT